jgi:hypothetical protein
MLADTLGDHEQSKLHYEASNELASRLGCVSYVV